MSGLLGKIAGQVTAGLGGASASASGFGGYNAQSSGPGRMLIPSPTRLRGRLTRRTLPALPRIGPGPYGPESHSQQQYLREHRADEYQQGHAGFGQGGYGGYQQPGGYPAPGGHLHPGQLGRKQPVGKYQQGHHVYGEGGYSSYQTSVGHQQTRNPDRGQHAEENHQERGQNRFQQPEGYQQAAGHEQADGRGYEQSRLRYGQSHNGCESERYGREQSQGGYRHGQGNPQQGHDGYQQGYR